MHQLTFTERTFVVVHDNAGFVQFFDCEPDSELATGQPEVETFTDEAAARTRAIELGYVFPEPEALP